MKTPIEEADPPQIAGPLPGVQKAAILLITLGDTMGAEILRQLPENEVQRVSLEIARLGSITPEQVETVLEEFRQIKAAGDGFARGGAEYASRMLMNAFGPGPAGRLLEPITKTAHKGDDGNVMALRQADPQQLASFIQNEHPQTIALILSNLHPSQSGVLLMSLPPELRADITIRMANLDRISPEVFKRIVSVVGERLKSLGEVRHSGGARVAADVLNGIDSAAAKEIMSSIAQTDPRMFEMIQHLLFIFDDLLLISKEDIKSVLSRVERKVLTMALKGTSNQLKNHFMQCMSERGAEMLRDDMEALGPVRIKDVEAAQQQIIATVRQLQAEGVISRKGSADQYVV